MAIGIVINLEVVHVDHHQREGASIAIGTIYLLCQAFLERAVVVQFREPIGAGKSSRAGIFQHFLNAHMQHCRWYRLGDEIRRARLHRFHRSLDGPVASDDDDGELFKCLCDLPEQVTTSNAWHMHIHEYHVERFTPQDVHNLVTVRRYRDLIAAILAEHCCKQDTDHFLIIDNEHFCSHSIPLTDTSSGS